jgi:LysM repeat protein
MLSAASAVGFRTSVLSGVLFALAVAAWPRAVAAQNLRGGTGAMEEQYQQARQHDFTKLRDPSHVNRFVELGLLVPLKGNRDYRLHQVSFPYARPEVRLFVERLATQYRNACGEQLVVTSLTRPVSHQPRNSSKLYSVHPMGMAVDLRWSTRRDCRSWLENEVLKPLEGQGTLQATLERNPRHYHIAVYPRQYASYVAALESRRQQAPEVRVAEAEGSHSSPTRYRVRSGDSLWGIARAHGTTVDQLKTANNLRSSRIYAGQLLQLPTGS